MRWDERVAVAVGGAAGAAGRWAVVTSVGPAGGFPLATWAVNVAGCLLLGVLVTLPASTGRRRLALRELGAVGFCGGLTTFSTFTVEIADLTRHHRPALAVTYLVASLAAGLAAALAGRWVAQRATPR